MISTKPVVWIVNHQHWSRAYLRAELIERGLEAVGFTTLPQALSALRQHKKVMPNVFVMELRGSGTLQKENVRELCSTGIPIILLGGAMELSDNRIKKFKNLTILKRPFTIGAVADAVEDVLDSSKE